MLRKGSFVALALSLAATLLPLQSAVAQDAALEVRIGAGLGRTVPGFTARPFAPEVDGVPTVDVHSGDVVGLDCCVILLPDGQDPEAWREANQLTSGGTYSPLEADPDADLPGVDAPSTVNVLAFAPSEADCGATADDPCDFDANGDQVLNTGDVGKLYVRITGTPNSTVTAVPQLPRDDSDLRIRVAAGGAATTTQAQLDEARSTLRAQDRARALELMQTLNEVNRTQEDGHWVYEVIAGYDEGPVSLFAFFPQNLRVPRGAVVRYSFEHAIAEPHTATFPFKAGARAAENGFVPACDPDGEGPGPDTQAEFSETEPPCDDPTQFELDFTRRMTAQYGDGVFPKPRRRYESSGLRGAIIPTDIEGVAGGTAPWDVRFNKSSRDEAYKYVCAFHGSFMSGRVRVR